MGRAAGNATASCRGDFGGEGDDDMSFIGKFKCRSSAVIRMVGRSSSGVLYLSFPVGNDIGGSLSLGMEGPSLILLVVFCDFKLDLRLLREDDAAG